MIVQLQSPTLLPSFMSDSDLIAANFSRAALTYTKAATIQKQAAYLFDIWLAEHATSAPRSIIELGCGTGFLSRHLQQRYPHTALHLTDLSAAMLTQCQETLPHSEQVSFAQLDAQHARFNPTPDWIVSAMCFQWFDNLPEIITRHCQQSRLLAFSILLDGSFFQWKQAHRDLHQQDGLRTLPKEHDLLAFLHTLKGWRMQYHIVDLLEHHANGQAFVTTLRNIGAHQARTGYRPINLRPLFRIFQNGLDAEYRIGFFLLERQELTITDDAIGT
jgi:malonyl-CoA O-methyltransferase